MSETQVTAPIATPKKPGKRRGPRRMSQSAKIRRALAKDVPVKLIAKRLGVTVHTVYRVRYKMKQEQPSTGIASLTTLPPTAASGIATYVEPGSIQPAPAEASTEVAPAERPTLWQRIKLYVWGKK